ncbi:hypothetical protein EDB89DRAFT_1069319 [Lactarius sanguifluus]|nr:hypothetical protein EDB89DRAFT_1069319 [Lactarius sanguifluus]
MLPDNVLLEIFDSCRKSQNSDPLCIQVVWKWHLLAHVCQKWRQIVFESPHRLNLQILCSFGTPVRKNLAIWPAFPIVIYYPYCYSKTGIPPDDEDDVIAALEHRDRLCSLMLVVADLQLEKITNVMQEPFPMLTDLFIGSADGKALVLPAEFLGVSAPHLKRITLCSILYPALPALLLSTNELVSLQLYRIPPTGYNSLEAMVASLAALPVLGDFDIEFQSATLPNDRIPPPPVTRAVLPALTHFRFHGASKYLEDLVAQIDCPQLKCISVEHFPQPADYQVTQLSQFIDRSVGSKLTLSRRADVNFSSRSITVCPHANNPSSDWRLAEALVSFKWVNWPVLDVAQLLSHFPTTLSNVIHLNLGLEASRRLGVDWLHLFRQFSAVQTLRISPALVGNVALALEDIASELAAEVLPSLDLVCIAGHPASSIDKFTAARRLSGCPVTIVDTEMEFHERLESYVGK